MIVKSCWYPFNVLKNLGESPSTEMKTTLWTTYILSTILIITFVYFVFVASDRFEIQKKDKETTIQKIVDLTRELINICDSLPFISDNKYFQVILDRLNAISGIEDENGNLNEQKLSIIAQAVEELHDKILKLPDEDKKPEDVFSKIQHMANNLLFEIHAFANVQE